MLTNKKKQVPLFIVLYKNYECDDTTKVSHANTPEELDDLKRHLVECDNFIKLEVNVNNPPEVMRLGMYAGANDDPKLYREVSKLLQENDIATQELNKDV